MGGAIAAVENAYRKEQLVESAARRLEAIESGEQTVVGVNAYRESEPSPLVAGADGGFLAADPAAEAAQIRNLTAWRHGRDDEAAQQVLADRKGVGSGKSVAVRVDLGGGRLIKKKKKQ